MTRMNRGDEIQADLESTAEPETGVDEGRHRCEILPDEELEGVNGGVTSPWEQDW